MKRSTMLWTALLLALIVAAAVLLSRKAGAAGPSALSRSAGGWLAARRYLEARGCNVSLLDRPLKEERANDSRGLVLSFPWEVLLHPGENEAVRRRLSAGGAVAFAFSGEVPQVSEDLVGSALGLRFQDVRGDLPLHPLRWREFRSAEWRLKPSESPSPGGPKREILIRAPRWVPVTPRGAQVLYRGERNVAMVFAFSVGRGRVLVFPADAIANARLATPGNADLLESVRAVFGDRISFDEFHHGLAVPLTALDAAGSSSFDLILFQLVLLYLLAVWAQSRRFGPAWRAMPVVTSSTSAFLMGLAALHRSLGHSSEAANRLIDGVRAYDPRVSIPQGSSVAAGRAGEGSFLELAQAVSRLQTARRNTR